VKDMSGHRFKLVVKVNMLFLFAYIVFFSERKGGRL
jgi:hypothetical protein